MRTTIRQALYRLRHSYWFAPGLLVLGAVVLAGAMVYVDVRYAPIDSLGRWRWILAVEAGGARTLLGTLAGATITVVSVTFSVTLLAVSHAATALGGRVVPNFLRDRGNQYTLGTFIATFVYCLLVLRTVETEGWSDGGTFVPYLAVAVALALALLCVLLLVYFLHHVPASIYVYNVVASIGRELAARLRREAAELPKLAGDAPSDGDGVNGNKGPCAQLRSAEAGYLQAIRTESLLEIAGDTGLQIEILRHPGEFVLRGTPLAAVAGAPPLPADLAAALRRCFSVGSERTAEQDPMFLVDQLVQIAARALSPGVNDPFTANTCVDYLTRALVEARPLRNARRVMARSEGEASVAFTGATFESLLDRVFASLRPYLAADRNATLHALGSLALLQEVIREHEPSCAIYAQARALGQAAAGARAAAGEEAGRIAEAVERCRARPAGAENEPEHDNDLHESA